MSTKSALNQLNDIKSVATEQKNDVKNLQSTIKTSTFASHLSPGGGMVDALVSGASVERRAGSSPVLGTL